MTPATQPQKATTSSAGDHIARPVPMGGHASTARPRRRMPRPRRRPWGASVGLKRGRQRGRMPRPPLYAPRGMSWRRSRRHRGRGGSERAYFSTCVVATAAPAAPTATTKRRPIAAHSGDHEGEHQADHGRDERHRVEQRAGQRGHAALTRIRRRRRRAGRRSARGSSARRNSRAAKNASAAQRAPARYRAGLIGRCSAHRSTVPQRSAELA